MLSQGLAVVFVGEVEEETELLRDWDFVGLDEFDEGAVGVFHIGEVSVGVAHAEVGTAVANEGMSHGFGLGFYGRHVAHVEAEMDILFRPCLFT